MNQASAGSKGTRDGEFSAVGSNSLLLMAMSAKERHCIRMKR